MRTTLDLKGAPEAILGKAMEYGLARSKTEAIRMSIFALNKEYGLIKDLEKELVAKKITSEKAEMKAKGKKYLSEEDALKKYKPLTRKK
ncbi:MAG: hypothetical protein AABW59_03605 [archaeon]